MSAKACNFCILSRQFYFIVCYVRPFHWQASPPFGSLLNYHSLFPILFKPLLISIKFNYFLWADCYSLLYIRYFKTNMICGECRMLVDECSSYYYLRPTIPQSESLIRHDLMTWRMVTEWSVYVQTKCTILLLDSNMWSHKQRVITVPHCVTKSLIYFNWLDYRFSSVMEPGHFGYCKNGNRMTYFQVRPMAFSCVR